MTLKLDEGRARVEELEREADETIGSGILTGMWSEGRIAWKVKLPNGTFYRTTDDGVQIEDLEKVVQEFRERKSLLPPVGEAFKKLDGKRTEPSKKEPVIDEEIIERARELNISERAIQNNGASRRDEEGTSYWLDLEQLIELDELDATIEDTDEFWAAFAEMRERHGIKAEYTRVKWSGRKSDSSGYMTSWWKSSWDWAGSKSELSRRLALALGVINATVQVINNGARRWKVSLATEEVPGQPTSYTDFQTGDVVVSPGALLDTSLDENAQIEITTGYGLHEASHVEHTTPIFPKIQKPEPLTPIAIAGFLLNVLEDVRIEKLTAERFPGFANYFVTMNAYLWQSAVQKSIPSEWGPTLTEKMSAIVGIVKWPNEYQPTARANKKLGDEFDWFREWTLDYIEGRVAVRESVQRALEHLAEDPETKQQMAQQAAAEKALGDFAKMLKEEFEKAIKAAIEQMKARDGKGLTEPCPSPSAHQKDVDEKGKPVKQSKLNPQIGQEIERLVRAQYNLEEVPQPAQYPDASGHIPTISHEKPELRPNTTRPARSPLLDRLRHAFRFRKARPMYSNRLLKSGGLDEEEMWRAVSPLNDFRVFEQRVIEADPDTQITMLIDSSGSMMGDNINKAVFLARTMLEVLKDMKGLRVRVRSHTTGLGDADCQLYRIWEPGDDVLRIEVARQVPMGGNYDSYAIAWCAEEMLRDSRPGEDMVLFVLSDGRPNGFGHAGVTGEKAVRDVTTHYKGKGITTIQIAIDRGVPEQIQRAMYDHYIPYINDEMLPNQLTQMLIKLFTD